MSHTCAKFLITMGGYGSYILIFRARGGFMSLDVLIERISLLFLKYTPHRMV